MDKQKNKTLPYRERNEVSCETSRGVLGIPIVVEPIVVPVPLTIVPIQVQDIAVAVRVLQDCIRHHLNHHWLNTLLVEFYSASQMPQCLIPSNFFF